MRARHVRSSGDLIADRRYEYARDLEERGELQAAADLYAQAVERAAGFAPAWFALGDVRERTGDRGGAIAAFRQALAADPTDSQGAGLRLAQLGDGALGDPPEGYVRALFDQYAPGFETSLRQGLAYRGPELIRAALERVTGEKGQALHFSTVIDLGCGTGLMGAALAGARDRLVGVDLSPGMIAQARRRGLYTRLLVADMIEALQAEQEAADLIVAADAFVYLADLGPVCRAAAARLHSAGLLAFSVETHDGTGVLLRETLRYAHAADHVREALGGAGLRLLEMTSVSTRTEAGAAVPGLVVIAARD